MIYTFYSYKGGVGRSMALANVGELFYQSGLNVLLIDWDLEAPGLERFFAIDAEEIAKHPGVMDMLLSYKHQMTQEWPVEAGQFPFKKPCDLTIDLHPNSSRGRLRLLTAGQRDKANFTRYANAVLTFDWKDLYDNWEGEAYFEWLRQQFLGMADVVLIDSRTGITEMGGVCTYQFADVVVMFCGTSRQNLEGTIQMVTELKSPTVEKARGRPLDVIVVPARVDKESGVGDEFKRDFLRNFAQYTPRIFERDSDYFWQLTIPYATVCAYREMIVAPESSVGSEDVYKAFARLTSAIARLAPEGSQIREAIPEARITIGGVSTIGTVVGGTNLVVAGEVLGEVDIRPGGTHQSTSGLRQATIAYFQALIDRHLYLNMKGMGVADRVPLRLPLLEVYVPLKARLGLPEGETWRRELRLAGRRLSGPEDGVPELRLGEPVALLDLLQKHDGLIILGDPGAGKTTFLKFLALKLALGDGATLGLGERLPVLVPLSAYANALSARDVSLNEFIAQYFHDLGADLPLAQMLNAALDAGTALVLLDGLDEVKDLGLRHMMLERVTDFYAFRRRKGNKFVFTSRVVGYRDMRPTADGLAECTLVDFEDEEIAAFVERWTATLERQAQGDTAIAAADAARERWDLLDAIQRNPSVRRLAANPLLLTILALMKRQGVTLPERRVELYDQYVTTLLSTWNRARGLGRPPSRDLDVVQTIRVLAPLALWMHEVDPGVGLVKREDLRRKLTTIYAERGEHHPEQAARQFLDDVGEQAGLLLERGPGEYGFIHLAFEEYLAAVAIALEGQGEYRPIMDRIASHVGDLAWREVALLAVGYVGIRQQVPRLAGSVVEALTSEQPGAPGEAVVLAGEAVLDASPDGVPPVSKTKVVAALVPTMQTATVPATLRRRAGLLLGRLGWLPPDLEEFVEVPGGEFLYGDDKQKRRIPYRYWIGKYPVTNAEYMRFIADKGYDREALWSADGWRWRTGSYDTAATDETYKGWLARRPPELRNRPVWWENQDIANPIFPVVGVTWFEAEAYANWLNTRPTQLRLGAAMPQGYCVRLATEAEWEHAARGADGRQYPWGEIFDPIHCNTDESDTERKYGLGPTAVCTYPSGVSACGAWDMSGNVWEWTCSAWSNDSPEYVLRGGSWGSNRGDARCAIRFGGGPDLFIINIGFRVVVSLLPTGS